MTDETLQIESPGLPYDLDEKLFWIHNSCDEDHDCQKECCFKISHNDWLKMMENISGISEDLLGPAQSQHN